MKITDQIFKEIEQEITASRFSVKEENVGFVLEVKDEAVVLSGLQNVCYGEIINFKDNIKGMVIDLKKNQVEAIIFGDYTKISQNDMAKGTDEVLSVPVSDNFLGRVVDGIGQPIDGLGKIEASASYPVERIAPGVIYRKSVDIPLQTGIKVIDALIPIGRGQRELIIGDRGTGKSTIAIDAILNQKKENVICIYSIIGQRNSKIASTVDLLKRKGAMEYTTVVAASASSSASLQYIAPYAACALGEFFMDKGRDVLIVYDDLTKHAWAYRQISLVLRRPSGREAYPGDIFYLHSRLLERACRLDKQYGGGSLTALPIVETQEGDVSSYIPTNIISITDGQIFLETDLFNAGIRPAVSVSISVSRVGSSAQTKVIKNVAGRLKFDLAQYRELAAFAQFESELDPSTKKFLDRGARITELLKQKKHEPFSLSYQVLILYTAVNGYLDNLPVNQILDFEQKFLKYIETRGKKIIESIEKDKTLEEKHEKKLNQIIDEFIKIHYSQYNFKSQASKNIKTANQIKNK